MTKIQHLTLISKNINIVSLLHIPPPPTHTHTQHHILIKLLQSKYWELHVHINHNISRQLLLVNANNIISSSHNRKIWTGTWSNINDLAAEWTISELHMEQQPPFIPVKSDSKLEIQCTMTMQFKQDILFSNRVRLWHQTVDWLKAHLVSVKITVQAVTKTSLRKQQVVLG